MEKYVVLFSGFEPDDEFLKVLLKENIIKTRNSKLPPYTDNPNIVAYVKSHSTALNGIKLLKGRPAPKKKIGFMGVAVVSAINTEENWTIIKENEFETMVPSVMT